MNFNLIILILNFSSLLVLPFLSTTKYNSSGNIKQWFRSTIAAKKSAPLKYILQWTSSEHDPFHFMGVGRQGFQDRYCLYTNCYVTNDINFLGEDYTKFDAVLFYGPDIQLYSKELMPPQRSPTQKYVFVSDKPSRNYPLEADYFDGFFNWTWTYKLDSDLRWGHIVVTDREKNIIGPSKNMRWMKREEMAPVKTVLKNILRGKRRAVVWMPPDCSATSSRKDQVENLQSVLRVRHGLNLDIYGECSDLKCISGATYDGDIDECSAVIRHDYYFYIAYEEVLSDDYVTTDILPALKQNAVPIVYGGANYSRFLPEGSYLNAKEMDTDALASKINALVQNPAEYIEYFKWTNYYQYYSTLEHEDSNQYCQILPYSMMGKK